MKLNEKQVDFILRIFPNECAGANSIARKLITTGKCIVAGSGKIWYGGIGNFITDKPAEGAVDCTELTFDLDSFLSSEWFKNIVQGKLLEAQRGINELQNQAMAIAELIKIKGTKFEERYPTSPHTFIHAKDVEVDEMTDEERVPLENDLIDAAIGRIKKDIEAGDVSAIFELLRFSPVENLIQYLPEDEQTPFKPLVHD